MQRNSKLTKMIEDNGYKIEVKMETEADDETNPYIWTIQLDKLIGEAKTLINKAIDIGQQNNYSGMIVEYRIHNFYIVIGNDIAKIQRVMIFK